MQELAQSDLRCARKETLHPWLSKMRLVKSLIRLREHAGWSESSLCAHVRRYDFWRYVSYRSGLVWYLGKAVLPHSCLSRIPQHLYHDETNKIACAPSEDSDQPGHPPSLIRVLNVI